MRLLHGGISDRGVRIGLVTWLDVVDELGGENLWLMPRRPKCPLDRRGVEGERPHSLSAFARQTDQRPGDDPHTQIEAGLEQLVILTRVTLVLRAVDAA
jgi:hypothetical protein